MTLATGLYREVSLDEALARARIAAREVGVTRVTDVTRLDRLGVPVCVAVRPGAQHGAICVSAGKGWSPIEARVGALMESVEQAWIEPGRASLETTTVKVKDILDGATRRNAILDLCPRWGVTIDLEASIMAVEAHDLRTGQRTLVPAELVYHPVPRFGSSYFVSGTNGLAGGASVDEATLHALMEALERDAISFNNVRDASVRMADDSLPERVIALAPALEAARVKLYVRAIPNAFGLPCFTAVAVDLDAPQLSIRGDGLHLERDVAVSRAITEALQCRLTIIHGGRDDLDHFVLRFAELDEAARVIQGEALVGRLARDPVGQFGDVPTERATDVASALAWLLDHLETSGFPRVYRVVYTRPDSPMQVVRVIVPGLECCLPETKRVGPRLRRVMVNR